MEALLFASADGRFLSPLAELDEVLMPAHLEPFPGGPGFLAGLLNLRGRILPVITLAERLGRPSDELWRRSTRILHTTCAGLAIGVVVDSVVGIRVLGQAQRRDRMGGEDALPFMADLWLIDGHMIQEIRLPALLRADEINRLAKTPPRLTA